MKKCFLFIVLFSIQFQVLAQTTYEDGYIIDNTGTREEVLILNRDWRTNPSEITYKTAENASPQKAGTDQLSEFGVGDEMVFRKFSANIDRSSERVGRMSTARDPQFSREEVFLKLLVAGEADLYQYKDGDVQRYFYSLKDVAVKPLVYKTYLENGNVAENSSYRQQLYENFKCGEITATDLRAVDYHENELVDFFEDYNSCLGADFTVYRTERTGGDLNFYVKAGADFSNMSIDRGLDAGGSEIDLGATPKIGAELEYVLPFNRNKWAIFAEATYQSYKVEGEQFNNPPYNMHGVILTIDMQYVAATGGLRHYLFLNQHSKFFVNAAFSFDIPLTTQILLERGPNYEMDPELDNVDTGAYFITGVGFNYSNRVSAELRYNFPRTTTGSRTVPSHYDLDWESTLSSFSVILAYRLF